MYVLSIQIYLVIVLRNCGFLIRGSALRTKAGDPHNSGSPVVSPVPGSHSQVFQTCSPLRATSPPGSRYLLKPGIFFFWKLFAGGLRDEQDEKKETQITQMRLRRSFAHRICCSSLAFPSERTGGVAVANAPANARETFLIRCFFCFPFLVRWYCGFASIFSRVCDSNEHPPGSGRERERRQKMR